MRKKTKKIECTVFVILPLLIQLLLSQLNELLYFRLMAFVMPIFICGVFVYYLCRYKMKAGSLLELTCLVAGTYGLGFIHYRLQQEYFHAYALENNLPLDLDGFAPLFMALIVHAFIYMALGIIIVAIFIFIKVCQHLFGTHEEVTPNIESESIDWSVWDDSDKSNK